MSEKEDFTAYLIELVGVLWKLGLPPSDEAMAYVAEKAEELGYEIPEGWFE